MRILIPSAPWTDLLIVHEVALEVYRKMVRGILADHVRATEAAGVVHDGIEIRIPVQDDRLLRLGLDFQYAKRGANICLPEALLIVFAQLLRPMLAKHHIREVLDHIESQPLLLL
jgi:hypothetical protein